MAALHYYTKEKQLLDFCQVYLQAIYFSYLALPKLS